MLSDINTDHPFARTWWVQKDGSRYYAVVGERDGQLVAWKVDPYNTSVRSDLFYHAAYGVIRRHPDKGWTNAKGYGIDPFILDPPNGAEPSVEFEPGGDIILSV